MRLALVDETTWLVAHVHMGDADHQPDGYRVVPSETANRGDRFDPDAGTFTPAPQPASVARPDDLLRQLRAARDAALAAPRPFLVVAPALSPPVPVLCDASDATMVDLGVLWRRGLVNPTGAITWHDASGGATSLTGAQCVQLETLVAARRDEVRAVAVAAKAAIKAGTLTSGADIAALAWPD